MSKILCALMTCLTVSSVAMQPGITYLNPVQGNGYHAGAVEPTSGMQDPRTQGLNAQGLYGSSGGQAWAGSSAGAPTGLSAQLLPASVFFAQQAPLQSLPMAASPTGQQATVAQPVTVGSGQFVSQQPAQAFAMPANCDVPAVLYFPVVPTEKPIPVAPVGHDPQQNLQERRDAYPAAVPSKIGTFVDTDYLEDLAIAYQAQSKQPCDDDLYRKILRDRAHALHLAAESPGVTLSAGAPQPFDPKIVAHFPEVAALQYFNGNLAQYRLRCEVSHHVDTARKQWYEYAFADEATAITPLVFNLLTSAVQQENPEAAFLLVDSSYHLLRFNDIINNIVGFWDGPSSVSAKLVIGSVKGTINAAQGMANFAVRVSDFAKRLYKNPNQILPTARRGVLDIAKACFFAGVILNEDSKDPEVRRLQHDFAGKVQSFLDEGCRDPEKAAAIIAEQLCYGMAINKVLLGACAGTKKAVGGAKTLAQALRNSQEVNWCLDDLRMAYLRWKSPARAAALASEVGPYE